MKKFLRKNKKWLLVMLITGFFCTGLRNALDKYISPIDSFMLSTGLWVMMGGWFYDLLNRVERHREEEKEKEKEKE